MRSLWCWVAVCVASACGRIGFDARGGDGGRDAEGDAAIPCSEPWSAPMLVDVGIVNVSDPSITADGLELFMSSVDQVWVSTRGSVDEPWSPAVQLGDPPNTVDMDNASAIRDDGLELYFTRTMMGNARVQRSQRATRTSPWNVLTPLSPVGSIDITPDALTMFAQDLGTGIRMYTRSSDQDDFTNGFVTLGEPVNVVGASSTNPSISSDGRDLYFTSDRRGPLEIWVAQRPAATGDFTTVEPTEVMGDAPEISADGKHLYFSAFDGATRVLYEVTRCL